LMYASWKGNTEAAKALLDGGADLNIKNMKGQTASMLAAMVERNEIVELLAKAGAK
jgi:uncharacterized protein